MGITVTADFVRALNATVRSVYDDAFASASGVWQEIATVMPSTQSEEPYAWIGEIPTMREFLDERTIKALKEYGFTIRNKTWEATIGVKREALEDEQTGQLRARVMGLAEAASAHYDELLFNLIASGGSANCYDGTPFYGNSHPGGGDNLTDLPFSASALKTVLAAMQRQVTPSTGEPMNVRPSHLLVPPELEFTALEVLNSALNPDSSGGQNRVNALHGRLKVVVSARLASSSEWHVLDCTHAVKPFIVQQRVAAQLSELTENSENGFMRDEFLYGVRSRDNAGFGLWQYAYYSSGDGS